MVNYEGLERFLGETTGTFGVLSMQALRTTSRLAKKFPERLKALYSAEHGFFGTTAAGEKQCNLWHPYWNKPIFSLYGDHRKPTDEMLDGVDRMVIDLQDIGVRCYTYLATIRNMLEACSERSIPVTVLDRPLPLGGVLDGPMRRPEFSSFVAPVDVPFCHGMTPGECAMWMRKTEDLALDLNVIRMRDWSHAERRPWPNFIPPSPAIRSWDSAVMYPLTVFTEAFPAVDCDRQGALAFRIVGAPWMDQRSLLVDLAPGLASCGVAVRPFRYVPSGGSYAGMPLDGILFAVANEEAFYPFTAGTLVMTAMLQRHGDKLLKDARLDWLDRLSGSTDIRNVFKAGDLSDLFQSWIDGQDVFLKTRVNLY